MSSFLTRPTQRSHPPPKKKSIFFSHARPDRWISKSPKEIIYQIKGKLLLLLGVIEKKNK
jgi:hypothetical protein